MCVPRWLTRSGPEIHCCYMQPMHREKGFWLLAVGGARGVPPSRVIFMRKLGVLGVNLLGLSRTRYYWTNLLCFSKRSSRWEFSNHSKKPVRQPQRHLGTCRLRKSQPSKTVLGCLTYACRYWTSVKIQSLFLERLLPSRFTYLYFEVSRLFFNTIITHR
jgi:uncharacterized membrane protein YbaN (DUF454 family)